MLNNKILIIGGDKIEIVKFILNFANTNSKKYRGLVTESNYIPTEDGIYNTSFLDLHENSNSLIELTNNFDHIVYFNFTPEYYETHNHFLWTKHIIKVLLAVLKINVEIVEIVDAENS